MLLIKRKKYDINIIESRGHDMKKKIIGLSTILLIVVGGGVS